MRPMQEKTVAGIRRRGQAGKSGRGSGGERRGLAEEEEAQAGAGRYFKRPSMTRTRCGLARRVFGVEGALPIFQRANGRLFSGGWSLLRGGWALRSASGRGFTGHEALYLQRVRFLGAVPMRRRALRWAIDATTRSAPVKWFFSRWSCEIWNSREQRGSKPLVKDESPEMRVVSPGVGTISRLRDIVRLGRVTRTYRIDSTCSAPFLSSYIASVHYSGQQNA